MEQGQIGTNCNQIGRLYMECWLIISYPITSTVDNIDTKFDTEMSPNENCIWAI